MGVSYFKYLLDVVIKITGFTDVLKGMNVTTELEKLQNNRALGPAKHRKQVLSQLLFLNVMLNFPDFLTVCLTLDYLLVKMLTYLS